MPTPKTITAKIVVPEWAEWRATSKSGKVFAFSNKPKPYAITWIESVGKCEWLFTTTPPRNWRKTLRRVK